MHIFYSPDIEENNFHLNEEESKHAIKVLRLTEKDSIHIIDGKGTLYTAEIKNAHPKRCEVRILSIQKEETKNYFIHIAIAPTKNIERTEWFVEKAIELGIDKISFIQSEHSERKVINLERIYKIAISAAKQSLKATLPSLDNITPFDKFIRSSDEEQKFIAHLEEGERKDLLKAVRGNKSYCVLIGPEGDFSKEEITKAKENGFIAVNLGKSRLRTETAAIAACHILNLANNI